ncbi:MAG: DnaJ domain-containing protein [Rhodospirillaceae bacterium]|nr:DnaJ domain-containing protein [Rhodospirillaceae bacterium]
MPYVILALGVIVGLAMLWSWAANADPKSLARAIKAIGLIVALVLGGLALFSRNAVFLVGLLPALLPLFMNSRVLANRMRAARGPAPGQVTRIETDSLRAELDHETGEVYGVILRGRHAGTALEALALEEIVEAMEDAAADDPRSVSILEAYLDRRFGPEWRDAVDGNWAGYGAGDGARDEAQGDWREGGRSRWGQGRPAAAGAMSRDEAYKILGLEPGASKAEITAAHHRLMKQMHPDQGGSDYLAAKLNEAKAALLGR